MNKGYITDSNLTHTRTRIKVTRARVRFILHLYLSIFKNRHAVTSMSLLTKHSSKIYFLSRSARSLRGL